VTGRARRAAAVPAREADLAARSAAGVGGALRLEDGRRLRVIFPGTPAGGSGPDFTGAILEAGGDLLRGDVELHLAASGWRAHGHAGDGAYAGVVLHVVAENDEPGALTAHASGRLIPVLVLPPEQVGLPTFIPPCALAAAGGMDASAALERLGLRRLRMKAARIEPLVRAHGPGQALYTLLLETLGGPANREPFAAIARRLPLAALLEFAGESDAPRPLALTAALKGAAASLVVRRAGLRPMASPSRRLEAAGELLARLWPAGAEPGWPGRFAPGIAISELQAPLTGRALALELAVNAALPVALAAGAWPESAVEAAFRALPSPGVYGKLRPLERWLGAGGSKPFTGAARLQGGLLLHAEYCSRGMCGRCVVSG